MPAHRAATAEAVKDAVLALATDPDALADLTRACADLFTAYNARAEAAEAEWLALIRAHLRPSRVRWMAPGRQAKTRSLSWKERWGWVGELSGHDPHLTPSLSFQERRPAQNAHFASLGAEVRSAEAPPRTITLAGGTLTCETSLRSNLTEDPELGRLVATERMAPPEAGPYSPLRRRWFAKAGRGRGGAAAEANLAGLDLALAPEWVRDPRLPAAFRAELASHLSGIAADWEAEARLVGLTGREPSSPSRCRAISRPGGTRTPPSSPGREPGRSPWNGSRP